MPWHDIALMLRGDAVIDLARHFVQYWYFVDAERVKDPYNHLRNIQRRYERVKHFNYPDW
jgi:phosphatidylserine/phosphatidylglycerophosphate/cardiolipin synthase-like enzyme